MKTFTKHKKMNKKNRNRTVALEKDVAAWINEEARKDSRSVSNFVCCLLRRLRSEMEAGTVAAPVLHVEVAHDEEIGYADPAGGGVVPSGEGQAGAAVATPEERFASTQPLGAGVALAACAGVL